jgi:hypothetical protein
MKKIIAVLSVLVIASTVCAAGKTRHVKTVKTAVKATEGTVGMAGMDEDYAIIINTMAMVGKDEKDNAAPEYVKAFEKYSREPEAMYKLRMWQDWPGEMQQSQRDALSSWVKANSDALDYLKQGSAKVYFWLKYPEKTPLGAGPLASYTQVNSLATAMCWRAKLKAADGDFQGAVEDIIAAYRFGGHIASPTHRLWEQTDGFTIQTNAMWTAGMILSRTQMDAASIAALQNQLQDAVENEQFYFATAADRVLVNEAIDRTFDDGEISQTGVDAIKRNLNLSEADVQKWQNLEELRTIVTARRLFGYFDLNISRTPGDLEFNKVDLKAEIEKRTNGNILIEKFRPDVLKDYELPFKTKSETEGIITICADKRYIADKSQAAPTLKVLVLTGYLKAEPMDPFRDNSPLTYVPMDQSFKLYSYGANFKNDFGKLSKWGTNKEGDQVFWPVQ